MTDKRAMEKKLKARVQKTTQIYIHNDLSGAAFHFKRTIETKLQNDDRTGISYDYMGCALMLAFTFEANLNFVGDKLFGEEWNERAKWSDKVNRVFQRLEIPRDKANRPFCSVQRLKDLRDLLAHGKPQVDEHDETVEQTADELDRKLDLSGEWEKACSHDLVFEAFDDVDQLWKTMLEKAGISHFDTLTQASGGITVIKGKGEGAEKT